MTEDQVTAQLEHTAGAEITSEEARWRMGHVIAVVQTGGYTFEQAARGGQQSPGHFGWPGKCFRLLAEASFLSLINRFTPAPAGKSERPGWRNVQSSTDRT